MATTASSCLVETETGCCRVGRDCWTFNHRQTAADLGGTVCLFASKAACTTSSSFCSTWWTSFASGSESSLIDLRRGSLDWREERTSTQPVRFRYLGRYCCCWSSCSIDNRISLPAGRLTQPSTLSCTRRAGSRDQPNLRYCQLSCCLVIGKHMASGSGKTCFCQF